MNNIDPPYQGEKCGMFLAILAVTRLVIWATRKKGLFAGANFSHRDLILSFKHQLWVKIRCNRKRFDHITIDKRWVYSASLVVRKGITLESSFLPLPAHGDDDPGSSGPHPRWRDNFVPSLPDLEIWCLPLFLPSNCLPSRSFSPTPIFFHPYLAPAPSFSEDLEILLL